MSSNVLKSLLLSLGLIVSAGCGAPMEGEEAIEAGTAEESAAAGDETGTAEQGVTYAPSCIYRSVGSGTIQRVSLVNHCGRGYCAKIVIQYGLDRSYYLPAGGSISTTITLPARYHYTTGWYGSCY